MSHTLKMNTIDRKFDMTGFYDDIKMKQSHAASVWSQLYECKMPLKGWHSMVILGQDYSMLQVLDRCYANVACF